MSNFQSFNEKSKLSLDIFKYFSIKKLVRKWRKRSKNSKHRLYVLREWIATQRTYLKDLKLIQEGIRKPLVTAKNPLITKEQEMLMFANVDVIITLSTNLFEELDKLEKKWNPLTTLIGPALLSLHAFFKIYLEYCNQFYKGQAVLKQIKGEPLVNQIEKTLPLDIASYLIKPVQRPPKYQLLLRDYLKHMSEGHPDYKNITLASKKYHEVNQINNQAIAREARVERMFYLAKLYDELLSSTRQFVNEFQASIFEEQVRLYVLSDMLLITREVDGKEALLRVILLDGTSFARRNSDGKYFLNKVFVCGKNECANLNFVTDLLADTVVDTIKLVIDKLFKKDEQRRSLIANVSWKRPEVKVRVTLAQRRIEQVSYQPRFRVSVEGVEKRPLSKFNDETFYVVKYELPRPWKMCQYVYTQLSAVEDVEKIVRRKVPSIGVISLRSDSIKMGTFEQSRNKTRVIEYRELVITEFLNHILRNDKIMANPLSLIEKLRIDENMWALAVDETRDKCTCQICLADLDAEISLNKYLEKRWERIRRRQQLSPQEFCLKKYLIDKGRLLKLSIEEFNSLDRMLLYLDTLEGRIDHIMLYKRPKEEQSAIVKVWLQNVSFKEFVELKIYKDTRVDEVMALIGRDCGLQCMGDFGLFINYSDRPRLLDGDEILHQILQQTDSEMDSSNDKKGLWEGLKNLKKWGEDVFKGSTRSRLYIRKYFFLPKPFEMASWHSCFQRQLLVLEQALYDVKRGFLPLEDTEISKLSAWFVCLKELDRIEHVKASNFPQERVKQILPASRLDLLSNSGWLKQTIEFFEKKKQSLLSMKEKVQLLCDDILSLVQEKPLWSTYAVEAENYDPASLKGNRPYVTIGVNPHNFCVFGDGELLSIPLPQLNYKVTVFSIFITHDEKKYRFDAPLLFNFSRIVERYKLLAKLVAHNS